jgi:hypothetical protein
MATIVGGCDEGLQGLSFVEEFVGVRRRSGDNLAGLRGLPKTNQIKSSKKQIAGFFRAIFVP